MNRLSLSSLPSLPASLRPPIDPCAVEIGIVHLGIGAFHRAHQAAFTQSAMAATGDLSWGICGVTQRSATVAEHLAPQDGLYTVLVRSPNGNAAQVNAAVRAVLAGTRQRAEIVARIASPTVRLV